MPLWKYGVCLCACVYYIGPLSNTINKYLREYVVNSGQTLIFLELPLTAYLISINGLFFFFRISSNPRAWCHDSKFPNLYLWQSLHVLYTTTPLAHQFPDSISSADLQSVMGVFTLQPSSLLSPPWHYSFSLFQQQNKSINNFLLLTC